MTRKTCICFLFILCLIIPAWGEAAGLGILTYNLHHAEGTDGVIDYQRLADIIRELNPDIVALQEVDQGTSRTGGADQARSLASLAGYEYFVFGRSMPYDGGEYGLAVMSRYPILSHEVQPLPFRFGLEPRTVLVTRINLGEDKPVLTFASTHLCHQSEENRIDQVRKINSILLEAEGPVILAGDFNARRDDDSMRIMWSRGWLDFSGKHSRIDYILGREQDGLKVSGSAMTEDRVASDHFPILVKVELPE